MKYTKAFPGCYFVQNTKYGSNPQEYTYYEYYKFEDLPTLTCLAANQCFEYVKISRLRTTFAEKEISVDHWIDKVLYRVPGNEYWRDLETNDKVVTYRLIDDIRNHLNIKLLHQKAKDIYAISTRKV